MAQDLVPRLHEGNEPGETCAAVCRLEPAPRKRAPAALYEAADGVRRGLRLPAALPGRRTRLPGSGDPPHGAVLD